MTTPTVEEIRDSFGKLKAKGMRARQAYNHIRTIVQMTLHEDAPSPYPLPPSKFVFIVGREPEPEEVAAAKAAGQTVRLCVDESPAREKSFQLEIAADLAARKKARALSVTDEHVRSAHEYNADAHPSDVVKDGIHYAQKMHQSSLWTQTDALVSSAIGVCP